MPTFISHFSYSAEAWQKLCKNPEDRSVPIKALLEKLGGKLVSMYYMAGEHDGIIIYEVADAKVAATVAVAAMLPGHVRSIRTGQLYTVAEAMEVMGAAGKLAFPAPKG
jgi:uncharacterized protein with GYD domain